MVDLHSHSTASDGCYSPSELVSKAVASGLSVLALTDHDNCSGLLEAQEAAGRQGLTFVPGIEINIAWPTGEFHLLGLALKTLSPSLRDIIAFLEDDRNRRNEAMAQKLRENGVDIRVDELRTAFDTKELGRPHFAAMLVQKGYVKTRQQAFDKYFAKGRPCFVDKEGADLATAVAAIQDSGGIPVQAHPLSMFVSWGKIPDKIAEVKAAGVMGLEAWHPGARISEAERLEELARSLGMIATGGSDFHGEKVRSDRRLGFSSGGLKIKDSFFYEQLLPLVRKLRGNEDLSFAP
ncbi:MAG: PHP domain-containing protein [Treponema sp.]|nr:PHP domain-containing protein [Treponema sp.]MCR5621696.1 PHP domain-containing protein [Treponema sp.]